MKRACGLWLVVYVLLAGAIGVIVHRRMPPAAIGTAIFGGFVACLGVAYLAGIPRKITEALMISGTRGGDPPRDGAKVAVVGRIVPTAGTLVSPLSKTSCVAYKYEIRSGSRNDNILYSGFALTPSTIQTAQGAIRLLAYPELKVERQSLQSRDAQANAEEYIRSTEFRQLTLANIRETFADMMAVYKDDDGTIRTDQGIAAGSEDLQYARYMEWLLRPGDHVCAIGRYSAQRNGLVPNPRALLREQVTIERGEPEIFMRRAIRGAAGYLIGGIIFLGAAVAGLLGLYAFVPLEAAEQMNPTMNPSWPEIRLEQLVETRLRVPMRQAGMLSEGTVANMLPLGMAHGRVRADGRDVLVTRADAVRANGQTTVMLDGNAVVLTIDRKDQPVLLRLLGKDVAPRSGDLHIDSDKSEVAGRLTFLSDAADRLACRVAFRAKIRE